ncbi:MAG TPA: hypothetical protein VF193_14295 [Steroidobacter sp.]
MLIIKSRRKRPLGLNEPIRHGSHKRPVTRRDFLAQGFLTGAATVIAPTMLAALLNPRRARALSPDIVAMKGPCNITDGAGKIPFICIDLAGGANIAGSNVLVGFEGGQLDPLSTQGYSKLGLPGDMLPTSSTGNFVNTELGLAFHSDSAFLRGILETTTPTTRARVNGSIIPARSENDTGNNPHNPMYGIARYGAKGELLTLIGSQNSDSGGNSMAPAMLIDLENRPTKIDRRSDVTGLVDIGEVARILSVEDTVLAMESMVRISNAKMALPTVRTRTADEDDLKRRFTCNYVKTADTIEEFGARGLDPFEDPEITSIPVFGQNLLSGNVDREFEKTAAVMKLVIEGYAGAGTISMGGYDYHTGDRAAGEIRDLRAGRCMGACLEYAARRGKPLMLYVFSDGSVSSNGRVDDSADGRGKGEWTSDNQQTAASFFLVYSPLGRPTLLEENGVPVARRQQIGYFRRSGDVETIGSPAANNVNLLVQTVVLNYMALHEPSPNLASVIPAHGLGDVNTQRSLIAFNPIVTGPV